MNGRSRSPAAAVSSSQNHAPAIKVDTNAAQQAQESDLANINAKAKVGEAQPASVISPEQQQQQRIDLDARESLLASSPAGRHLRSRISWDYNPRDLARLPVSPDADTLNVVLLLSGSFNPPHRSHIRAGQVAAAEVDRQLRSGKASIRRHLEAKQQSKGGPSASASASASKAQQQHSRSPAAPQQSRRGPSARVLAVAMVPSSDGYVAGKLGNAALSCKVRCELCDLGALDEIEDHTAKVAQLAEREMMMEKKTKNKDDDDDDEQPHSPLDATVHEEIPPFYPVITCAYNQASGSWCARLLDKELSDAHPGKQFITLCVYGSDCAWRWGSYSNMVCVERHDSENTGKKVREKVAHGNVHGENFIFVPTESVPGSPSEVPTASSTAIRHALDHPDTAESKKVLSDMLHPRVVEKLAEIRAHGGKHRPSVRK